MSLTSAKNFSNIIDKIYYEKYYSLQLFYCILFGLSTLKKNGSCTMIAFSFYTEISIELLFIIKKYFKKIILTTFDQSNSTTVSTKIFASKFKGITKKELDELFKIGEEISKFNDKYDDFNNNYKFIKSILNIDKNSLIYQSFRKKIIKYNLQKKKIIENNIDLFNKIIDFLEDENNNNYFHKLKNIIFEKQIQTVFYWINKHKIIN
jgi:hypothetical protein